MKEAKYITFLMDGLSDSGKTQKWRVVTKEDEDDVLGYISWYNPWRCYAFTAFCGRMFQTTPVFEKRCLRDLANFLEEQTNLQRQKKKSSYANCVQSGEVKKQ